MITVNVRIQWMKFCNNVFTMMKNCFLIYVIRTIFFILYLKNLQGLNPIPPVILSPTPKDCYKNKIALLICSGDIYWANTQSKMKILSNVQYWQCNQTNQGRIVDQEDLTKIQFEKSSHCMVNKSKRNLCTWWKQSKIWEFLFSSYYNIIKWANFHFS